MRISSILLSATVILTACGGGGDAGAGESSAATETGSSMPAADATPSSAEVAVQYAPELGVDLGVMSHLPSGLYMKDIEVGEGELAINGKRLLVKYTGWLSNGVEFDSNMEAGEPLAFTLGNGDVIRGWEEGMQGMRPGGRRMFVIPPALGYGDRGYPGLIPPGSTLVFDVTLVEVHD